MMCGRPTTRKLARTVVTKSVEVVRERGWRCGGMMAVVVVGFVVRLFRCWEVRPVCLAPIELAGRSLSLPDKRTHCPSTATPTRRSDAGAFEGLIVMARN